MIMNWELFALVAILIAVVVLILQLWQIIELLRAAEIRNVGQVLEADQRRRDTYLGSS